MSETPTTSPEARYSPLHEVHVAAGASFTDFAGWQMPVRYSGDLAEHHAVRTAAGLFDLSHMAEILVVGPEAVDALDYALASDISAVAAGRAKYTLLLERTGGVIDDLVVYRTGEDRFMVVANAANRHIVVETLRDRTAMFECELFDESDDVALIALQGPRSLEILQNVQGLAVETERGAESVLDTDDAARLLAELRYYRAVPATFEAHPILIARTGYTGEDGFEIYVSPDSAPTLWQALAETGAGAGLVPAGLAARDTLRLEAGMPLYGHELSRDVFPAQAGLGRVVAFGKPIDFVGRAASEEGPSGDAPVLVGLVGEGRRAARADYTVLSGDDEVGVVTSGVLSPTLGVPIAMAYVAPASAQPGTALAVDIRGTRLPMTVTELPFYSRKKN
ncbi:MULTISPECIES: glycine cleavage system aminomethyltransferase GcvT [unclassified Rathayibacter]|jgi:aminomethyltransferase|uniref:glycine cleavage system aminomethyltransferase GcvT n=1 Tax=unclassified Rathayibacter TaxID=2609250 RepID=UPI000CE842B0|nr:MULTISPECIES: glycine cleavage system aminomethyltransferase GcvT [unclassified Rathayibacter]PPF12767.1 glycine cleavage system protein T [Rathayibacter sp. AY1A5]PPF49196.1 glycine cleavage system protein T [Rathayibacter sp. AY1A1]PPF73756.1 glycine cleavage system protein T [Rathayibacter sp. AY1E6]PPG15661.1 glycine cleavage system protein T [Rathayibacter sp. AY1E8]PPG34769.1 glycine cleavage system protein T [Rathayibacter sp. AY2B9]